jgi:hypothetical protein
VAIKTVKTLDIKMPYPIEMKRLMGKWRCRDNREENTVNGVVKGGEKSARP